MEKIIKAGFYISWYEFASALSDENRHLFYDAILDYYFKGIEPDPSSPVSAFFILIKPSIDKDIKSKRGGSPVGNQNARKTTQNNTIDLKQNNGIDSEKNNTIVLKKTNKVKVNVKDNVNDKVNVKVNRETDSNTNFLNLLNSLTSECSLKISASTKSAIQHRLEENNLDADFLSYCLDTIKEKYPDSTQTEINSLFVSAVLSWDNLVKSYKLKTKKAKKSESKKSESTTPPPETCSYCGTTLELGAMENSVECPQCREKGMRTWWESINGQWICNR